MGKALDKGNFNASMDTFRAKRKKFLRKIRFEKWKGWIYLAPCLVLLAIFTVWPIFNTLRMAFWNGYGLFKEIGGDLQFEFGIKNFKWFTRGTHNLGPARLRSIEVFYDWAKETGVFND